MTYPARAVDLARRFPAAIHILYHPIHNDAMRCLSGQERPHTGNPDNDCPYVNGPTANFPGYLIATPARILNRRPTTHSLWTNR